jgi:hypothetical protein
VIFCRLISRLLKEISFNLQFIKGNKVNKFITNLIIAITAFIFGSARASALNQNGIHLHANAASSVVSDAMGNVCANQD